MSKIKKSFYTNEINGNEKCSRSIAFQDSTLCPLHSKKSMFLLQYGKNNIFYDESLLIKSMEYQPTLTVVYYSIHLL